MKKYQIDWVQFAAALITIGCLVGAVAAMFALPRQPWPLPLYTSDAPDAAHH